MVAVEAHRSLGPIDGLVRPRVTLAVLQARGQSDDGRQGRATEVVPYGGVELGLRRALARNLGAGLIAGAEVPAIHQEFLVDDERVVDLGRLRLHVGLTLTVGL